MQTVCSCDASIDKMWIPIRLSSRANYNHLVDIDRHDAFSSPSTRCTACQNRARRQQLRDGNASIFVVAQWDTIAHQDALLVVLLEAAMNAGLQDPSVHRNTVHAAALKENHSGKMSYQ